MSPPKTINTIPALYWWGLSTEAQRRFAGRVSGLVTLVVMNQ